MLREDTVFGPIKSRRLGWSLGINLLPQKGKICNFDCIYCECGWNSDGRDDKTIPSAAQVRSALEDKLADILLNDIRVDSITFSGDGEPTLNPDFPQIIDDCIRLRDCYCPQAKVSVLSNATTLGEPEVFEALRKVDNPILKLDAARDEWTAIINRSLPSYHVKDVIEGMKAFKGDFILQTMFLKSEDFDSLSPEVFSEWCEIVRSLKPRLTMAYTIARPTPQSGLIPYSAAEMKAALAPLMDEGYKFQICG
ncbi:MAG: radical SAM protein [Candidatus Cryptobacteroides sp.]